QPPLMRLVLIQLSADQYQFIWTHHHALLDGWSVQLLFKDLLSLYHGIPRDLAEPIAYQRYVAWLQAQDKQAASDYWQTYLTGFAAPTDLVPDNPVITSELEASDAYDVYLDETFSQQLQALARTAQVSLNTVLQGAWALLLSHYSGDTDVVFGYTRSGRPTSLPSSEAMIGLFITSLPMRVQVPYQQTVSLMDWLKGLHQVQPSHEQYGHMPLVEIQQLSEVPADQALFESLLIFENYPIDESVVSADNRFIVEETDTVDRTSYPLSLTVIPGNQMLFRFEYLTERFSEATVKQLSGHLENLLRGMLTGLEKPVSELTPLSREEQASIIAVGQAQHQAVAQACIHELFEQQVATTPDQVALVFEDQSLTYAQLNSQANQLAHYLIQQGVKPDSLVGICLDRSPAVIVAMLATLKAGGAYVPLDPTYPTSRLAYMVADSQVQVILSQAPHQAQFVDSAVPVVDVKDPAFQSRLDGLSNENPCPKTLGLQPDHLAYIIYTSGSTGKPKGVMIEHRTLVSHIETIKPAYGITSHDRVLQFSNLGFDASVEQVFESLTAGATLYLRSNQLWGAVEFKEWLQTNPITITEFPPLYAKELLTPLLADQAFWQQTSLRCIVVSGDVLNVAFAQAWQQSEAVNHCLLINNYGP
ncbi:AMP-binding protein, partial [Endozoicomonas sp. SM1973]